MIAALPEQDIGGNEVDTTRAREEAYRMKVVTLREELRGFFNDHGSDMSDGISNADLVASVAQLSSRPIPESSEHLDATWQQEYALTVQSIGSLIGGDAFTVETDPKEIVKAIQTQYDPLAEETCL